MLAPLALTSGVRHGDGAPSQWSQKARLHVGARHLKENGVSRSSSHPLLEAMEGLEKENQVAAAAAAEGLPNR